MMRYTDKKNAQLVIQACLDYQIEHVVISPGSRNAPLIIGFDAFESIKKYSIVDERSAAFFALGMARQTRKPVALVCSSGSALLNYYPAIAEAYYSRIPLLILSADRPQKLLDIGDGQTIRQKNVFANHILFSTEITENNPENQVELLRQAMDALVRQSAPVHINIPFDEPLYQMTDISVFSGVIKKREEPKDSLLDEVPIPVEQLQIFADKWNQSKRKMLIVGVYEPDAMLQTQLQHIAQDPSVIVLVENTSNVRHPYFIESIDQLVFSFSDAVFQTYKPEIVLTLGGMVVSKKIKRLLRHGDAWVKMDTYHSLTHHFTISSGLFFSQFFFLTRIKESDYRQKWLDLQRKRKAKHDVFIEKLPFSDLKVYATISRYISDNLNVHFANSTAIRYAQLFSWKKEQAISCNRGTSGIDGSVSTAVGMAVVSRKPVLLITGDLSFFYDSNALWNPYVPVDFRIVLVNNGGGGIFRFIPGPDTTASLAYFETSHGLRAENLCKMHDIHYENARDIREVKEKLSHFFEVSKRPKLLEIFTDKAQSATLLKAYFEFLKE